MSWIKAHYGKLLFGIAVLCLVIAVVQYFQMVAYNNCDWNNWKIVIGWAVGGAGVSLLAAATNLPAFHFPPQFDVTTLPGSAPPVKSPMLRTASTGTVAQVADLRHRAEAAHKNGDDLNAVAAELVAKMEAELAAAKKLLEGVK